jgi:hypothetical protein
MQNLSNWLIEINHLWFEVGKLDDTYPCFYENVITVLDRISDIYADILDLLIETVKK